MGYTGDLCELQATCVNCAGECYENSKCTKCKVGWTGSYCTQPSCTGVYGMCVNDGKIV